MKFFGKPSRTTWWVIIGLVAAAAIACLVVIVYFASQRKTDPSEGPHYPSFHQLDGYEDGNGVVYECSHSLRADRYKNYGFASGSEYRPADPVEASKYCHATGIE